MWNRVHLKQNAKLVLKQSYWMAFLAALVYSIFVTGSGTVNYRVGGSTATGESMLDVIGIALFAIAGVLLLLNIFVFTPIEVGAQRYFLEATQYRFELGNLVYGFGCGNYQNVVITMFLRNLYIFLWSLLLVIPGVVKSYAYQLVPYILAENPNIPAQRAIALSCEMTRGHKVDMLILDLSFLGWYLLGALCFGFGVLFVTPYDLSTKAELYVALRAIAIDRQMVSLDELEGRMY